MSVTEGVKVRADKYTYEHKTPDDKITAMLRLSKMVQLIVYTNYKYGMR